MKKNTRGQWTSEGWSPMPESGDLDERTIERMNAASDLAHRSVEELTRKVIGLATDGGETPGEMTRWYFACLIEAMVQLGIMSGGIITAAVQTLHEKCKTGEKLDPDQTIGDLLGFVNKARSEYGKSLVDRIGKGEPTEFQESFSAFLDLSNMLKEEEDGRKEP